MYSADLRWTHDSRTSGEQQKALFARPYKYSQVYSTIYDKNVFKYVRICQMVFYMLWKPVWLIWSNPKNYFILVLGCLGCLQVTFDLSIWRFRNFQAIVILQKKIIVGSVLVSVIFIARRARCVVCFVSFVSSFINQCYKPWPLSQLADTTVYINKL